MLRLLACAALLVSLSPAGSPVPVDTGAVASFDAAGDSTGAVWVALAWPDAKLQLFRSTNSGETWQSPCWFRLDSTARMTRLLVGPGRSRSLFLFYLSAANSGDLWLLRVNTDSFSADRLPVAVGPDTIDDFSVTLDRDSLFYLYCIYANEHRDGLTARFTRSFDQGSNWEFGLDWWNCWDPEVSWTAGSDIHCVWRYATTGREVHYSVNRRYGEPGHWQELKVLSTGGGTYRDPAIIESDTVVDDGPSLWAFSVVGRRDTQQTDLEYAVSADGGRNWFRGLTIGELFVDEWAPALLVDRSSPRGWVDLCYNVGGSRPDDPTRVAWRCCHVSDPDFWSAPVLVDAGRAVVAQSGAFPRLAWAGPHVPRGAAVLHSRERNGGADGVWLGAAWRPVTVPDSWSPAPNCVPNPSPGPVEIRFAQPLEGNAPVLVCDPAGRVVRSLAAVPGRTSVFWDGRDRSGRPAPSGVYLVRQPGQPEWRGRLVLCRP